MRRNGGRCGVLLLGLLAMTVSLAGCASAAQSNGGAAAAEQSPQPSPTPSASGTVRPLDHVVIIVDENKPAGGILGNPEAPYINGLAAKFALAGNYSAVMHPSLPNYLAMTAGTTGGISTDCSPRTSGCQLQTRSIADSIVTSGRTWKMYAEGMPSPCSLDDYRKYAVRHNPFVFHPSITDDAAYCAAHDVPFTQLQADLATASSFPDYAFISPNLCNDMHNCSVGVGDTWLSNVVPTILASPAFKHRNSLLIVTWDEGSQGDNSVMTIFAGPAAKPNYLSEAAYNHYSLLHTIENAWGLAPLTENDRNAPPMDDMLR